MPDKGIWRVYDCGLGSYYAERVVDGWAVEHMDIGAHCLACAKTEVMAKTGIPADIRGWHNQDMCGSFLKAMRTSLDLEGEEDE